MKASEFNDLVLALEAAEQTAHRSGLYATAHAINAAKNQAGWERAEQLDRATDPTDAGQKP